MNDQLQEALRNINEGKFVSITYRTKEYAATKTKPAVPSRVTVLTGRVGVKKYVKGTGPVKNSIEHITFYDFIRAKISGKPEGGYRTLLVSGILEVRANGKVLAVAE